MSYPPGPWRAENGSVKALSHGNWFNIAVVDRKKFTEEGRDGTARLIAASPELLAELERMYEAARCMADPEHCLHHVREELPWADLARLAKAAITKAKGGAA